MKIQLSQINPFVRFAGEIILTSSTETVSTLDHRLLYVVEGSGSVLIEDSEKKLQAGTVALWLSGTRYKLVPQKTLRLFAINFDYTRENTAYDRSFLPVSFDGFSPASILEDITFTDASILNSPLLLDQTHELFQDFDTLLKEHQKQLMFSDEYCSVMLKKIILNVMRAAMLATSGATNKLDKIIEYIEANYSRDISNSEIADVAGYHPYHINRLMHEYTGSTIHRYITDYRLKKAQEFLINTSFMINEISELCGFNSAYYFTHIFREKFGITPTEYRKSSKNNV